MKITDIKTFLMHAGTASSFGGGWSARNWLFVKIYTDEGLYGVGECSGWPRVIETAIKDLTPILIGEDPFHIEKIWQKILVSTMGHGMTGVVGSGAMTGIDMRYTTSRARRSTRRCGTYSAARSATASGLCHANTPERALELTARAEGAQARRRARGPRPDGRPPQGGGARCRPDD